MKLKSLYLFFGLVVSSAAFSQDKFYTKNAQINFYSSTKLEDIEANNRSVVCVLDTKTGALQFTSLIKGFEFENEEMQEHFNDHYLESDRFPKSEFKGQVINFSTINFKKPGNYPVQVKGLLTLHGITKEVTTNGFIKVNNKGLSANSSFLIKLVDYGIKIPTLVKNKISKEVKVTVDAPLEPLK